MPANGQAAAAAQINSVLGANLFNNVTGVTSYSQARSSALAAQTAPTSTSAPSAATSAPTKGTSTLFTGLCDALNQHQQELVSNGTYEVADQYSIQFAPAALGSSTVVPPGGIVYASTPTQNPNTASAKLDPKTDQVNTNAQIWQVLAGTQVVQLIDQVMRSSSYVRDQQKIQIDPTNNTQTKSSAASLTNPTVWYKISVQATPLAYDNKRRDFAYQMTYVVNTYAINQMASPYFNNGNYRGAHKAYNYWFTGQNTQILSYEQEYNHAYYVTLTNKAGMIAQSPPTGRDQRKHTFMATSEQRGQGQATYTNNPADSAAAFLYNTSDFAQVRLKIVGDPAWIQQGEIAVGVNPTTFNFTPFNADGGINYDSQEVVFSVAFNQPVDYDLNTGLMNVNAQSGLPQAFFAYRAITCKNVFSKGQFTQELTGALITGSTPPTAQSAAAAAPTNSANTTATGSRNSSNALTNPGYQNEAQQAADGNGTLAPTSLTPDTTASTSTQTTQPASAPGNPTSSGDIAAIQQVQANYNTSGGGFTPPADAAAAVAAANPPQQIAQDNS